MPIIFGHVPKSFFDENLTPPELALALKSCVVSIRQLDLAAEEVSVILPECYMSDKEIIIFVAGLYEKPERTMAVLRRLARRIRNHLIRSFPEAKRVECFIFPFNPITRVCSSSSEISRCVDCDEEIDTTTNISVQAGCVCSGIFEDAFPCKGCGLLHWKDGMYPVEGAYFDGSKVVHRV
jgi:hypothetical protein